MRAAKALGPLSRVLALLASKELRISARRIKRNSLALGLAGLFMLSGYLFLLAALALWLAPVFGPAGAALVVGVGLFGAAGGVVAGLAYVRRREARARRLRRIDETSQAALLAGGVAAARAVLRSKSAMVLLGAAVIGFLLASGGKNGGNKD